MHTTIKIDKSLNYQKVELENDCYIELMWLTPELKQYVKENFNTMFSLHPPHRHKIISFEEEIETNRWSQSYMNTPCVDHEYVKKNSYMYSGFDTTSNNQELPSVFQPLYQHIQTIDTRYNQCIVNWYQDKLDNIAMHSDCQRCMSPDAKIAVISIYPSDDVNQVRQMKIKSKVSDQNLRLDMHNGMILVFSPKMQDYYRHGIGSDPKGEQGPRISVSFRQIESK